MTDFTLDPHAETPPDAAAVRDPVTDDMFDAPSASTAPSPIVPYQVLARKYRPRTFEDLIGQEAMVRTLSNAFTHNRIAHAFMLTGVRGVGKTTTARLLARALNYATVAVDRPSVDLAVEGRHCRAIIEGRHMDVLELDAASRTKVDEMRELLDSVRYAPLEARYKVYVIDEVHMLSTAAFNALLKTLEEPPPHAKFVFATTEIRKVPVTILSRCQRFDLRRVEPPVLSGHLGRIAAREGAVVDDEGLALIARAAEGSVRDGLSLLDQAIVQTEEGRPVTAAAVRDMLGLADRAQTIALFEEVMRGEAAQALRGFRTLYGMGADPSVVAGDLLEHAHAASVAKALGRDALGLPSDQAQRLLQVGAAASAGSLARVWQMLLKAHEEVRRAPDPAAALEMALIRLAYAADLPGPEEALKALREGATSSGRDDGGARRGASGGASLGGGGGGGASGGGGAAAALAAPRVPESAPALDQPRPQARSASPSPCPEPQTFGEITALIASRRDALLQADVARFVRPIGVRPGAFAFALEAGAPRDLPQRLSARLSEWTGRRWLMEVRGDAEEGVETAWARDRREKAQARAAIEAEPIVQALLAAFPGAEIVQVRHPAAAEPAPAEASDDGDQG